MAKQSSNQESNFKAVKKGKYLNFVCSCGSDMWNNIYKKNKGEISDKSPDLRCKDSDCSYGDGKNPNSIWLTPEELTTYGFNSGNKKGNPQKSESKPVKKVEEKKYANNQVTRVTEIDVPLSMYAAWAKDIAIFLAEKTGVSAHDDFDALYRTCLINLKNSLISVDSNQSVTEFTVNTSNTSEDVSEDILQDVVVEDDDDEVVKDKNVDEDFEDLDFEL